VVLETVVLETVVLETVVLEAVTFWRQRALVGHRDALAVRVRLGTANLDV